MNIRKFVWCNPGQKGQGTLFFFYFLFVVNSVIHWNEKALVLFNSWFWLKHIQEYKYRQSGHSIIVLGWQRNIARLWRQICSQTQRWAGTSMPCTQWLTAAPFQLIKCLGLCWYEHSLANLLKTCRNLKEVTALKHVPMAIRNKYKISMKE